MGASWDKPKEVDSKYFNDFKKTLPSLEGKVVAVTGCTTGTGFIAAKTCAELCATVIMLNRKSERSDAALEKIKAAAPNSNVVSIECDLMDFESVRKAASEIRTKFPDGLDVLVNNAGIMASHDQATKDGYDIQMQTNHLSHFLLTKELMPLLEKAAEKHGEARIVNHSSLARKNRGQPLSEQHLGKNGGSLGGDDWGFMMDGPRWIRYQNSKLANIVFTRALHSKLTCKGSKVKTLVAAPGVSSTNLMTSTVVGEKSEPGGLMWLLAPLMMFMIQSAEDGTMPLLHCMLDKGALAGELYEPSEMGGRTGPPQHVPAENLACICDAGAEEMLWHASEAACGPFVV